MNNVKFAPEGWNDEITKIDKDNIDKYIKNQEILQGLVKECDNKYNLYINFENGLNGIIPREEVEGINLQKNGLPKENLCIGKVHKFVQFKIKEQDKNDNLILSRKEVQEDALRWVKTDLKEGDIVTGIVKNIKPYGAFIEIGGGVVGLVHIEDLSVARIKTPEERLKIGQKLKIMVKSIDRENGKVFLSYKEMFGSWEENVKKFTPGVKVKGKVRETEKNKNGIFIELAPNLVGMAEYEDGLDYGQDVDVYIKKIDLEKKKVKLLVV
ncbi:MAG: S1 RNA-binding domain-containing protein [Clostridia bacterium]|nr:S1 RNA-binding domain-containing protein [Clostridia bacterium]